MTESNGLDKLDKDMENLIDLVLATNDIKLIMDFERYGNELNNLLGIKLKYINQKNLVEKLGKDIREYLKHVRDE